MDRRLGVVGGNRLGYTEVAAYNITLQIQKTGLAGTLVPAISQCSLR